jgi:putative membrane protein
MFQGYYFKGVRVEYLLDVGFLGTHAPYYMDGMVVYLLSLPLLMTFSILLASKKRYALHRFTQILLFLITLLVLLVFNYGIHVLEHFDKLMIVSSIGKIQLSILLVIEIFCSILLLIFWLSVLLFAQEDSRRRGLPGLYSLSHRKSGKRVFVLMLVTVLSTTYLYWMFYSV